MYWYFFRYYTYDMNVQLWIGGNTFIYLQHLNMLDLPCLCELTRVWFSSTILINWYWYSGSGTAWFASQSWYLKFHTVWNSDGFAWKLSQKGHYFPKLLSFCCSSCSFLWQVGNIAIDPICQNGVKNNPGLRGSFYKCINSNWFESCTKCLGFDLSAATLGKIWLDPFPLFRFEDLYRYGIRFFGVGHTYEYPCTRWKNDNSFHIFQRTSLVCIPKFSFNPG